MFQFLAAAVSIVGQQKAGRAAQTQAQQEARQMEIDREIAKARATEEQNQRFLEYDYARATNNAQFSFNLGGGESSSLDAFRQEQQRTMRADLVSSQRMSRLDASSRTVGALIEVERGRNARRAANINSLSTIFQTAADVSKTTTGTPT